MNLCRSNFNNIALLSYHIMVYSPVCKNLTVITLSYQLQYQITYWKFNLLIFNLFQCKLCTVKLCTLSESVDEMSAGGKCVTFVINKESAPY